MNNVERDSKQYDLLVMETSTQEKFARDRDWCVPVKHVAKLSRMRGSTSAKTNIKFCVDPEEEDRRKTMSVTNAAAVRLFARSGSELEISPPRSQVYEKGNTDLCEHQQNNWAPSPEAWLSIQELEKPSCPQTG